MTTVLELAGEVLSNTRDTWGRLSCTNFKAMELPPENWQPPKVRLETSMVCILLAL